jgi:glycosyltransferase involved in cell wall biosynthesis
MRALLVGSHLSEHVGTRSVGEELALRLRDLGWPVITTSHKLGKFRRLADMLKTIWARRLDYDIALIEVFSGNAFLWAEAAASVARRLNKPIALALHGGGLPEFASRHSCRVKRLLSRAERVASPSKLICSQLSPFRSDIVHVPNGIQLSAYPFRLRANARPALCWLRAFHETYNPLMAVETLAVVSKSFPEARLAMTGPDKGDGTLEAGQKRVAALHLEHAFQAHAGIAKSEVPARLNQSDIFLNTTNYESFGVTVLEAAACGLCTVCTSVGELPLMWQDGQDTLLVPRASAQAMAAAVTQILTDPATAERLSHRARTRAEAFDWAAVLPRWCGFMQGTLKGKGQPLLRANSAGPSGHPVTP